MVVGRVIANDYWLRGTIAGGSWWILLCTNWSCDKNRSPLWNYAYCCDSCCPVIVHSWRTALIRHNAHRNPSQSTGFYSWSSRLS